MQNNFILKSCFHAVSNNGLWVRPFSRHIWKNMNLCHVRSIGQSNDKLSSKETIHHTDLLPFLNASAIWINELQQAPTRETFQNFGIREYGNINVSKDEFNQLSNKFANIPLMKDKDDLKDLSNEAIKIQLLKLILTQSLALSKELKKGINESYCFGHETEAGIWYNWTVEDFADCANAAEYEMHGLFPDSDIMTWFQMHQWYLNGQCFE